MLRNTLEKTPLVTPCRVVSSKSASCLISRMLCNSCERRSNDINTLAHGYQLHSYQNQLLSRRALSHSLLSRIKLDLQATFNGTSQLSYEITQNSRQDCLVASWQTFSLFVGNEFCCQDWTLLEMIFT